MTTLIHEIANVDHRLADFRRRFPKLVLGTGVPLIVAAVILVPVRPLAGTIVFGVLFLAWILAMVRSINRFEAAGERFARAAEEQGFQIPQEATSAAMTPGRRRQGAAWVVLALVSSVVWVAYILAVYPLLDPPLANAGLALVVLSYVGLQVAIGASRHTTRPAGGYGHG